MHKYIYLLKNMGLLTISNFGTKVLSFVLIPLYTNILSTSDYGTYDVYSTTVSLLIPVLTLSIVESVMLFTLDANQNKTQVFMIGLRRVLISIAVFGGIVWINNVLNVFSIFTEHALFLFLLFAGSLLYSLLSQFSRGIECITDVAVAGALNSIAIIGFNVLFLAFFDFGLIGYFAANCLSYFIPIIYLFFRLHIWNYVDFSQKNTNLKTEMFSYSKPLVFNNIAWWINNVSDRYIVTWICGVAANGIYSVAYKIPSVLNIFQSIFSQAWTVSAIKEFNEDSGEFYSVIYKIYNCGMTIICSGLILLDKMMAKILFANDFYIAWQYAPFLTISVVFGALSGMLGGVFSATKKSKMFAQTTMIGAGVNTVLNIILVRSMGPGGAAVATLISYLLVWAARLKVANKIIRLNINLKRDIFSYFLLLLQALVLNLNLETGLEYLGESIIFLLIVLLYFQEVRSMVRQMKD